MATKLYLHNASNSQSGTWPIPGSPPTDGSGNGWGLVNSGGIYRTMNTTIGTAQVAPSIGTNAVTTTQVIWMMGFVSPPLDVNQTVGGGNMTISIADSESNLSCNWWVNNMHVYVWRPSTGAVVGHLTSIATGSTGNGLGSEATSTSSEQVTTWTTTTSAISASAGDVIIVDVGGNCAQSMAASYTITIYYDGTTESTTENAVVSNIASYINLSTTNTFSTPSGPTVMPFTLLGVG